LADRRGGDATIFTVRGIEVEDLSRMLLRGGVLRGRFPWLRLGQDGLFEARRCFRGTNKADLEATTTIPRTLALDHRFSSISPSGAGNRTRPPDPAVDPGRLRPFCLKLADPRRRARRGRFGSRS